MCILCCYFFFFNDTATTEIYTLSLHDALPIWCGDHAELAHQPEVIVGAPVLGDLAFGDAQDVDAAHLDRSEEHTSELQSRQYLVCRLLLEKKKKTQSYTSSNIMY